MLNKKQFTHGCFDITTKFTTVGQIKFKTCLGNYYNEIVDYYWNLFTNYENNMLPYNGNYGEQPAKIVEIFNIIKSLINKHQEELKKAQKLTDAMNKRLASNGR